MFVKLWLLIIFTTSAGTHISDTSSTIDGDNNLGRSVIIPVGAEGVKRAIPSRSVRDLCARPWTHILRIWFLYRMGLAMGLIENLARFISSERFSRSHNRYKSNFNSV